MMLVEKRQQSRTNRILNKSVLHDCIGSIARINSSWKDNNKRAYYLKINIGFFNQSILLVSSVFLQMRLLKAYGLNFLASGFLVNF